MKAKNLTLFLLFLFSLQTLIKSFLNSQILEFKPYARSVYFSHAYVSICDDAGSILYNPAGLGRINYIEIVGSQNFIKNEVLSSKHIAAVYSLRDIKTSNIKNLGTIAVSELILDPGYIPGNPPYTKSFTADKNAKEQLMTISYGKNIYSSYNIGDFFAGVSVKFYKDEFDNKTTEDYVFDIGLFWQHKKYSIGLAIENIGNKYKFDNQEYNLPLMTLLGFSYKIFPNFTTALAVNSLVYENKYNYNLGLEYTILKFLTLGLGYDTNYDNELGIRTGIGITLKDIDFYFFYVRALDINYSISSYRKYGDSQFLTINLKLGAD